MIPHVGSFSVHSKSLFIKFAHRKKIIFEYFGFGVTGIGVVVMLITLSDSSLFVLQVKKKKKTIVPSKPELFKTMKMLIKTCDL